MLNAIGSSQIIGLMAVDGTTTTPLGTVEDIWLDRAGRITYLSSSEGYLPLEQVSGIGTEAISTYGQLVVLEPSHLHRLHRLAVQSAIGEPLGWISDELSADGHDRHALAEATQFLHDRWESLQHQIGRASDRAKAALESAWNQLTNRQT
jgi:PRC-barrel domain